LLWTSNGKSLFIKVVDISNILSLVTNLTSFGFGMKDLCILEVEENYCLMVMAQNDP
jgi:hypothetical protein